MVFVEWVVWQVDYVVIGKWNVDFYYVGVLVGVQLGEGLGDWCILVVVYYESLFCIIGVEDVYDVVN